MIKTNFLGDEISKENVNYACIACITIDSVMRMEKNLVKEVYLKEWKYKMKKTRLNS